MVMEHVQRRRPVYLLLDCSGSMTGEPIESLRQGIRLLVSDLSLDPYVLDSVQLSVISFASSARQVCPLTPVVDFQEPILEVGGSTSLGEALELLEQCIDTEVQKSTATRRGDLKPFVFIITDGQPTDNWVRAASRIRTKKVAHIIACAAGAFADFEMLERITDTVIKITNLQPESFRHFFSQQSLLISMSSPLRHGSCGQPAS